jgi:hypothetical protein
MKAWLYNDLITWGLLSSERPILISNTMEQLFFFFYLYHYY